MIRITGSFDEKEERGNTLGIESIEMNIEYITDSRMMNYGKIKVLSLSSRAL